MLQALVESFVEEDDAEDDPTKKKKRKKPVGSAATERMSRPMFFLTPT